MYPTVQRMAEMGKAVLHDQGITDMTNIRYMKTGNLCVFYLTFNKHSLKWQFDILLNMFIRFMVES